MRYVYTNYAAAFEVKGVVFACEAEDIMAADKLFFAHTGKKMSDKDCTQVTTYSPDWPCNRRAV